MNAKYKINDEVIISGTLTGIGDVKGTISDLEYNSLSQEYFYLVKSTSSSFWSQERYLRLED